MQPDGQRRARAVGSEPEILPPPRRFSNRST